VTAAERAATRARKAKAAKSKARITKAASAAKPTPRAGTKQAQMIEMLKRPEGATVEQIAAATGWQHHTIRGANSGALKKKLGLMVEATRTREVGPNKTGAKGSAARCPTSLRWLTQPRSHGLTPRPRAGRRSPRSAGQRRPGQRRRPRTLRSGAR